MSFWDYLVQPVTETGVRSLVVGFAQAAKLKVTNWRSGSPAQQMLESMVSTAYAFVRIVPTIIRGFASLDTATDPGDVDTFDGSNVLAAPASGFLSNLGANTYGTTRGASTFASGFVTFVNAGAVSRTFAPGGLSFTWTSNSPPNPAPTYTNSADAAIYTSPGGTATVAAGSSLTIPVKAQTIGAYASAPSASLSLTTTLLGCTATNAEPVVGDDREDAEAYRERCRAAAARLSFGGPEDAFFYFGTKDMGGDPLVNSSGSAVNINRVQVTASSSTGRVDAYFASPSGAASGADITAANANILLDTFAVPDCVTYAGHAATEDVLHVGGVVKIKARAGMTSTAVKTAILNALTLGFKTLPIGGVDRDTNGDGWIYTADLEEIVHDSCSGLYDVRINYPAGTATPVTHGHVLTLNSVPSDWTVTVTA